MSQVENRSHGAGCLLLRSVSSRAAMPVSANEGRAVGAIASVVLCQPPAYLSYGPIEHHRTGI